MTNTAHYYSHVAYCIAGNFCEFRILWIDQIKSVNHIIFLIYVYNFFFKNLWSLSPTKISSYGKGHRKGKKKGMMNEQHYPFPSQLPEETLHYYTYYWLGDPHSTVIYNEFQPPLPRVSKRDIGAMKVWISPDLTHNGTAGNDVICKHCSWV